MDRSKWNKRCIISFRICELICSKFSSAYLKLLFGASELLSKYCFVFILGALAQVDAALVLLGNLISNVSVIMCLVQTGFYFFQLLMQLVIALLNILFQIFFNSHFLVFQDLVHKCVVPQEVWDLRLFKQMPSVYVMHCLSINHYV